MGMYFNCLAISSLVYVNVSFTSKALFRFVFFVTFYPVQDECIEQFYQVTWPITLSATHCRIASVGTRGEHLHVYLLHTF